MAPLLFLLLLVVPIVELWIIVQVAGTVGIVETLVILVLVSAAGAALLKQQGMATWARLKGSVARGEVPAEEVTDGALILLGGALLLTPGFLTDVLGLVLLVPPSRAAIKGSFRRLIALWARRRWGVDLRRRREVEVVRVERREPSASSPDRPSRPEIGDEDDSQRRT